MRIFFIMVFSVLLFVSLNAFEEGTINPGGTFTVALTKHDSKADPLLRMVAAPQLGYFIIKNVAVDIVPTLSSYSQTGKSNGTSYSSSGTEVGIGLGGRMFYNGFYGGLSFSYIYGVYDYNWGNNRDKDRESALYLIPKLGMVMPVAKNVYGDLGISYNMGVGKAKDRENYNGIVTTDSYNNEYRSLQLYAGLQAFFSLK